jgi:hypothetical protein
MTHSDHINVRFSVVANGGEAVDEATLRTQIATYRSWLQQEDEFEGVLELRKAGGVILTIEDALPAIVKNFCFLSIPDILASQPFVYHYYSSYGQVALTLQDTRLLITDSNLQAVAVDQDAFIRAVYDCGVRFINLLEQAQTPEPHPKTTALIALLNEQRAIADQARQTST